MAHPAAAPLFQLPGRYPQIEGQIMHLQEASDHNELLLGIHALGLEATNQGRQNLRRIVDVVEEYEKTNNPSKKNPNIMTA